MEKLTNLEGIYTSETEKLRSDLERLQLSEEEAKIATGRVLSLQEEIAKLRKDLEQTQSEKKSIEERADRYKQETEQLVSNLKEENTLLKQEKEALNHLIVEQAKEMTGKARVAITYSASANLRPTFSKLQLCLELKCFKKLRLSSLNSGSSKRQAQ